VLLSNSNPEEGIMIKSTEHLIGREADSLMAAKNLSSEILANEHELSRLKWFDYRFLSPVEATIMFLQIYQAEFRRNHGRYYDIDEAELKKGLSSNELFMNEKKTITALWRARQLADRIGMPYELFAIATFNHLMDGRNYKQLPAPNQLYSEHAEEAAVIEWAETQKLGFRRSCDPRYKNEHFCGEPAQEAYIQKQLDAARKGLEKGLPQNLSDFCFDSKTLPVDRAKDEFGSDVVEAARKKWAGTFDHVFNNVDVSDLRPSCFAVIPAHTRKEQCKCCRWVRECDVSVPKILRKTERECLRVSVSESIGRRKK
jgi:hypothetical protein